MEDDFKKLSSTMANVMVNVMDKSTNNTYAKTFNADENTNNVNEWGSLTRCDDYARKGGVRLIANVTLNDHSKNKNIRHEGFSNTKVVGNAVQLGILNQSEIDVLRVEFSRVFINEGKFNHGVVSEVRPSIMNTLNGSGSDRLVVVSVGAGMGGMRASAKFLEGNTGDSGLLFECAKSVFAFVRNYNLAIDSKQGGASLSVEISACEVCEGSTVDLLDAANNGESVDGGEDGRWEGGEMKVELNRASDFNKVLGVVSSLRGKRRRQQKHSHCVIKLYVNLVGRGGEKKRWCEFTFLDLCVPCVDDNVLFANEIYDTPSYLTETPSRDLLYAQEDSSAIAAILEKRIKGDEDEFADCESELLKALPGDVFANSAIRVFVHVNSKGGRASVEETKEAASSMLFASLSTQ